MNAQTLANELAPRAVALLRQSEPELLQLAGGPVKRAELRMALPLVERCMPVLLRDAIRLAADRFGGLSIAEMVQMLEDCRK